jgi:FKBP-type peptidyl-prolyl cis-trans isomerase FklB
MNKLSAVAVALACSLAMPAFGQSDAKPAEAQAEALPKGSLKTPKDAMSYATGVMTVRNFNKNNIQFDPDLVAQGMRDALSGKPLALTEKEIRAVLNNLQTDLRRAQVSNRRVLAEQNLRNGLAFQAEFKKKPGVKALPNGILYRVISDGTGAKPLETDSVVVKYRGTQIDGTEFDATEEGKTATIRLQQGIVGWREAIKQMPVGSHWEVIIPAGLAYSDRGVGEIIGPNETLVFDVELVAIKPQ